MVKKLLITLPFIFCILLSSAVPLLSFADSFNGNFSNFPAENAGVQFIEDIQDCSAIYDFYTADIENSFNPDGVMASNGYSVGDKYISFNTVYHYHRSGSSDHMVYRRFWWVAVSESSIASSSFENDIISISFSSRVSLHLATNNMVWEYGDRWYVRRDQSDQGTLFSITGLNIDLTTNQFTFIGLEGNNYQFLFNSNSRYALDIDTNIVNVSDDLLVDVVFTPMLHGNVDRNYTLLDGTKAMRSTLNMSVANRSRFPIQYKMWIEKTNQTTHRGGHITEDSRQQQDSLVFDDDPVFVYFSDSWVYSRDISTDESYHSETPVKVNKASAFHLVQPSSADVVTFNFSQINLQEGESYTVYVEASRNDFGYASELVTDAFEQSYEGTYEIQRESRQIVFQDTFTMLQYSDIVYNPNDSSNGVKPYNGANGVSDSSKYNWSRNAKENEDGSIDYKSEDKYSDLNSWINTQYDPNAVVNGVPGSSGSSGSYTYKSLENQSLSFFQLIRSFLSFLPSGVLSTFTFGFSAVIIIMVWRVFKGG